jgi:hypothetical protein
MSPKQLIQKWVEYFNNSSVDELIEMYADDAINHQVVNEPVVGKEAIYQMFCEEFAKADMECVIENIFEDGEWAILEWSDPQGLRGCGFFHIKNNKIVFQRGYWDKLSFCKLHGLPIPQ